MSEVTLSINGSFNSNDCVNKPVINTPVVPIPLPIFDNPQDTFEQNPAVEDFIPTYSNLAAYRDATTQLAKTSYWELPQSGVPSAVSVRAALEAVMSDLEHGIQKPIIKNPAPLVSLLKELTR
jgi:hypothetical protein